MDLISYEMLVFISGSGSDDFDYEGNIKGREFEQDGYY